MSSGESGSQQLQLLFSRASIPARLRIILKENINTDKNYKYTGVVEEIYLALVQSKLGGMTLHALRAWEARAPRACVTLTLSWTDFEKKNRLFCSLHFIWVSMYLAQKCWLRTPFLHPLLETEMPREGLAVYSAKAVSSFLSNFKSLLQESKPATSSSVCSQALYRLS